MSIENSSQLGNKHTWWRLWGFRTPALLYLAVMILLPLVVIIQDGFREGIGELIHQISLPLAQHAIVLTLWTSALMTLINAVMGLATAYVFVRYAIPGKRILNTIIDLPLAIPSLVTGVMLVLLYGPQSELGGWLTNKLGINIIFAPPGIVIALLFITFPFVVRSIQPVLENLDQTQEYAAATLGSNPWSTFWRIVFPNVALPLINGSLLSFSRAVGEFGAVVIVAGNIPLRTQTAAVYTFGAVESENRLGASAVSIFLIGVALIVLIVTHVLQERFRGQG